MSHAFEIEGISTYLNCLENRRLLFRHEYPPAQSLERMESSSQFRPKALKNLTPIACVNFIDFDFIDII